MVNLLCSGPTNPLSQTVEYHKIERRVLQNLETPGREEGHPHSSIDPYLILAGI